MYVLAEFITPRATLFHDRYRSHENVCATLELHSIAKEIVYINLWE